MLFCLQEVADLCFLRLNLILIAIEARKYFQISFITADTDKTE